MHAHDCNVSDWMYHLSKKLNISRVSVWIDSFPISSVFGYIEYFAFALVLFGFCVCVCFEMFLANSSSAWKSKWNRREDIIGGIWAARAIHLLAHLVKAAHHHFILPKSAIYTLKHLHLTTLLCSIHLVLTAELLCKKERIIKQNFYFMEALIVVIPDVHQNITVL